MKKLCDLLKYLRLFLHSDKRLDIEGAAKMVKAVFNPSDDDIAKIDQVHKECGTAGTSGERCEAAYQRASCSKNMALKLGLPVSI